MRRTLVVMVKEPRPGRVKTRLGRDIGMIDAAWWYRRQTRALLMRLRDPRWRIVLAVTPDVGGLRSRVWPTGLQRRPQRRGDLGTRMGRQLHIALRTGPACLIGSDIPGIGRSHIAHAFAALGTHDCVFGPAEDGGFWLVGFSPVRCPPPGLFSNVRWSGPHALADTLATLPDRRIALTDRLSDVDDANDLHRPAR